MWTRQVTAGGGGVGEEVCICVWQGGVGRARACACARSWAGRDASPGTDVPTCPHVAHTARNAQLMDGFHNLQAKFMAASWKVRTPAP